jgi:putative addiction module killer protein
MITVFRTHSFQRWLDGLRDRTAVAQVAVRIARLKDGNPGDMKPVGEGVLELRIHSGPGYRIYLGRSGDTVVVLLAGGDKSTQTRDIASAKQLWRRWKDEADS